MAGDVYVGGYISSMWDVFVWCVIVDINYWLPRHKDALFVKWNGEDKYHDLYQNRALKRLSAQ